MVGTAFTTVSAFASIASENVRCTNSCEVGTGTTQRGCDVGSSAMISAQYILYVFRHCDLVLKVFKSVSWKNNNNEQQLKIKKNSFTDCHSKGLIVKVKLVEYFSSIKKYARSYWNNVCFV